VLGDLQSPGIGQLVFPNREPVAMPKVTVDEHRYLCFGEYDIRATGQVLHVFAEPQAAPVQFRANAYFESRVLSLATGHTQAPLFGREVIWHSGSPPSRHLAVRFEPRKTSQHVAGGPTTPTRGHDRSAACSTCKML